MQREPKAQRGSSKDYASASNAEVELALGEADVEVEVLLECAFELCQDVQTIDQG